MSRNPSLHITEKALIDLINHAIDQNLIKQGAWNSKQLAEYFLLKGKKIQLTRRSILENKKESAKISRVGSSKLGDAELFNRTLSMVRTKLKHRGFKKIFQNDRDWQFIKESTHLANEFHDEFSESFNNKEEAYINYITLFFEMLEGGFSVRRIPAYHERITERYSAALFILSSGVVDEATEMHEAYQTKIYEKTGNNWDYTNRPEEFVNFIKAVAIAKEVGLSTKNYVKAQFDSLDWASAIPYPKQLSNLKAKEKAIRWMSENNIMKEKVLDKRDINKLKNLVKKYEDNSQQ